MASRRKRYTRSNLDPDPASPVENPENILKNRRYKDQSTSTKIQRSNSLSTPSDRVSDSVKIDISPPPLHKTKSDTNLKKCFEEISILDKNIPKSLSQQTRSSLWSLPVKKVKRKSDYSERTPSKFPKVAGKG